MMLRIMVSYGCAREKRLLPAKTLNPPIPTPMKKTCFLLMTCNVQHSHGLEHGVFLRDENGDTNNVVLAKECERMRYSFSIVEREVAL